MGTALRNRFVGAAVALIVAGCQGVEVDGDVSGTETYTKSRGMLIGGNMGGTNLGGANLGGSNLSGTNLGGPNLGGTNLGGPNLGGTNLGGTNLGGPNLAGNNLSGTNLGGANLAGNNLAGSNLGGVNLSGSNLSGSNLAGSNLGGSNLAGTSLAFDGGVNLSAADIGRNIHVIDETSTAITTTGTWTTVSNANAVNGGLRWATTAATMTINFVGTGVILTTLKGADSGYMRIKLDGVTVATVDLYSAGAAWRSDVYKTTQPLSNQSHTLTLEWTGTKNPASLGTRVSFDALRVQSGGNTLLKSGEDFFHAATPGGQPDNSCVVMGIGSTAFTRLVTANAGANMYALVDKLPWGFSATSGGAMDMEAWEVLVWGSHTYCVFVVPAPIGTTYDGVGGFVKAVFRWNAPPSKTISIGKIGGGQTPASYTGMMNAAAKFVDDTLNEKNLIAGLLSFVTATTNDISVNVDFASWVQLKDGSMYVLGNPSIVDGVTQYNEGTYASLENADGTLSVYAIHKNGAPYGGVLDQAYADYQRGLRSMPVPKRCAGAKHLFNVYGVPVPNGKCDTGVDFLYDDFQWDGMSWNATAGASANDLSFSMHAMSSVFVSSLNTSRPVRSGTHIYVNELPFY